jgi:leader peptidase (prepilin peptidase)/N-methyltransferase
MQPVLGVALVAVLVPAVVIDLERRVIPNRVTGPAALVAIVLGLLVDPGGEPERLVAGVAAAAFLLGAALVHPEGMGMGDVKLAGVLGLFLGRGVATALLVALLAGALVGLVVVARLGVAAGRRTTMPFGPFLALGGLVGAWSV